MNVPSEAYWGTAALPTKELNNIQYQTGTQVYRVCNVV